MFYCRVRPLLLQQEEAMIAMKKLFGYLLDGGASVLVLKGVFAMVSGIIETSFIDSQQTLRIEILLSVSWYDRVCCRYFCDRVSVIKNLEFLPLDIRFNQQPTANFKSRSAACPRM